MHGDFEEESDEDSSDEETPEEKAESRAELLAFVETVSEVIAPGKGHAAREWVEQRMTPLGTTQPSPEQLNNHPQNSVAISEQIIPDMEVLPIDEIYNSEEIKYVESVSAKNVELNVGVVSTIEPVADPDATIKLQKKLPISTFNSTYIPDNLARNSDIKSDIFSEMKKGIVGGQKIYIGQTFNGGRSAGSTNAKAWGILLFYARHGKWPAGLEDNERMRRHYAQHDKLLLAKQYVRAERRGDHDECKAITERALKNNPRNTRRKAHSRKAKKS